MIRSSKRKIFDLLNPDISKSKTGWYIDIFLLVLILLNVAAIVLESVADLYHQFRYLFGAFEIFSVVIFTVEYLLRLYTLDQHRRFHGGFKSYLKHIFSFNSLIDLFAILPFYLPLFGFDLRLIRLVRLFRVFRLFKVARYVKALKMIEEVLKDKKEELIISLFFIIFFLMISSTVIYYVEFPVQPDVFSSIPKTLLWGLATLTSSSDGDMNPITDLGKFLSGLISFFGVILFALPTGIFASGFTEQIEHRKGRGKKE